MKVNNQVNSLELGRQLAKCGVNPHMFFFRWIKVYPKKLAPSLPPFVTWNAGPGVSYIRYEYRKNEYYPALTVAELGQILHKYIGHIQPVTFAVSWEVTLGMKRRVFTNEADARAALLVYCLKHGYISLNEINIQ